MEGSTGGVAVWRGAVSRAYPRQTKQRPIFKSLSAGLCATIIPPGTVGLGYGLYSKPGAGSRAGNWAGIYMPVCA